MVTSWKPRRRLGFSRYLSTIAFRQFRYSCTQQQPALLKPCFTNLHNMVDHC